MQVSKQKINANLGRQLFKTLYQLVVDLKNSSDAESVISSLLTEVELTSIAKRLAVAYWLTKGRSYSNIKDNLKVSSATIAEVKVQLKTPGWKLAIQKITAEEWATAWDQRLRGVFKRV